MGKGTAAARAAGAGLHADVIDDFKDELLIAFLRRLGGKLEMPVAEIDNLKGVNLAFRVVDGVFYFEIHQSH